MTKLEEHAAYLKPDPLDANRSIFTVEVSVTNAAINMGGIEAVAAAWLWNPATEPNPCEFVIAWVKEQTTKAFIATVENDVYAYRQQKLAEIQNYL